MNNAQRSIGFTIGLMGTLLLMMLINPILPDVLFSQYSILYIFAHLILFVLLQNGYQTFITHKFLDNPSMLFAFQLIHRKVYDRLSYYGILFLLIFASVRQTIPRDLWILKGAQLLVCLLFIEGFFYYRNRTMKAQFSQQGILIHGFDTRMDIPLGTPLYNSIGFYTYDQFAHYTLKGELLELILHQERGKLQLKASPDMHRQLMGFFQAKGISIKKINHV